MCDWIDLYYLLDPFSFPLFFTINEGSFKKALVLPDVLSKTVRFSVSVISDIDVTIVIDFSAFTMLDRV